jgi:hypothetical protein
LTAARRGGAAKFEKPPARVKKYPVSFCRTLLGPKMPWSGHIPYPRPVGHAHRHMTGARARASRRAWRRTVHGEVWDPPRRAQPATNREKTATASYVRSQLLHTVGRSPPRPSIDRFRRARASPLIVTRVLCSPVEKLCLGRKGTVPAS